MHDHVLISKEFHFFKGAIPPAEGGEPGVRGRYGGDESAAREDDIDPPRS
jgi:hypothetical protein